MAFSWASAFAIVGWVPRVFPVLEISLNFPPACLTVMLTLQVLELAQPSRLLQLYGGVVGALSDTVVANAVLCH